MSNITPTTPSFLFGYWRPWKEDSNFIDSYLNYRKDVSLTKYGADTVGKYINEASKEQVQAINQLGQAVGRGMNILSNQMSDVNDSLNFLNRNMDIQIEQQKLSNLLLQNIVELLRVPDSEKERQHSIELGIKFFVNAKKDSDLYADSLEELLKAESLMKQDYFVLHRIGCIYLYVEKYINPEKALDYFLKAAKYASVESDIGAVRLANALTNNFNTVNSELNNSEEQIGLLAADSYEKAAFAAYVLGRFEDAVNYQSKALKFNSTSENRFILSKYQVRNNNIKEAIDNLDKSINDKPIYAIAAFKELDLINEPEVIKLIAQKNDAIDHKIKQLTEKWKTVESTKASEVIKEFTTVR
jgi:tetratricopeptide (TPR) repeat protein